MLENGSYQRLLKKLLLLELVGENFYKILSLREQNEALRNIYQVLEKNEKETGLCIKQELKSVYDNLHIPMQGIIITVVKIISNILPLPVLKLFLKNTLNNRTFRNLSIRYKNSDSQFWKILVKHEHLQHELLAPYWNQS